MINEAAKPPAVDRFLNDIKGSKDPKFIERVIRSSYPDPAERRQIIDYYKSVLDKSPYKGMKIVLEAGRPTGDNNKIKSVKFNIRNCDDDEGKKAASSLLASIFNSFNNDPGYSESGAHIDQGKINELTRAPIGVMSGEVPVRDARTVTMSSRSSGNLFQRRVEALKGLNGLRRFKEWWVKDVLRGARPSSSEDAALDKVSFETIDNNVRYMYVDFTDLANEVLAAGKTLDEFETYVDTALKAANKDLDAYRDELGLNDTDELPNMRLYKTPAGHETPLTTVRTGYKYLILVDWKQV